MSAADALAAMHPQWQEFAARLKVARTRLSKKSVPMLHRPAAAIIGKAAATLLGVTTLLEDAGSKALRLGVFTLPSVPADILDGPKGVCMGTGGVVLQLFVTAAGGTRASVAAAFVSSQAMESEASGAALIDSHRSTNR